MLRSQSQSVVEPIRASGFNILGEVRDSVVIIYREKRDCLERSIDFLDIVLDRSLLVECQIHHRHDGTLG